MTFWIQVCFVKYMYFMPNSSAKLGVNSKLAKTDIKSAFRLLPIYPGGFDLLDVQFKGQYYINICLPMCCSISCSRFETNATFLHWMVAQQNTHTNKMTLDHYLDDLIFAGPSHSHNCSDLGVPIAEEQTCGPTSSLILLGLVINTGERTVKIPTEKVRQWQVLLLNCLGKKEVTLKEIKTLVGIFNFTMQHVG